MTVDMIISALKDLAVTFAVQVVLVLVNAVVALLRPSTTIDATA